MSCIPIDLLQLATIRQVLDKMESILETSHTYVYTILDEWYYPMWESRDKPIQPKPPTKETIMKALEEMRELSETREAQ